jgi:hypothetical protein
MSSIPPGVYFGSGFVALLAVAGDVRMIMRGGIVGAQRIARQVWRSVLRCLSPRDPFSWVEASTLQNVAPQVLLDRFEVANWKTLCDRLLSSQSSCLRFAHNFLKHLTGLSVSRRTHWMRGMFKKCC